MTSFFCKQNCGVVLLLILLLLAAPTPTTAQSPQPNSGPRSLPIGFHIGRGDSVHMEAVRAAGGSFAVVVFSWANIEPEPNYLYWEIPDAALRAAEFYGIKLIARLDQPPDWALDAGSPTPWNLDAYANFTRRVAERYGDRLAGIILWNEPNLNLEWNNQPPDATAFAELLKAAYPAAKSAAPEVPVLLGGLASTEGESDWAVNDLDYLQALYAAGAGDYFDILAAHPYGFGRPPNDAPQKYRPNFRRLELYRQIMNVNGDAGKPVWVTEMGWLTETNDPNSEWQLVSPETQAEYILGAIDFATENYPWLEKLGIWQLNTHGDTYGYGIWHGPEESSPAYEALAQRERAGAQGGGGEGENSGNLPPEILAADAIIRLGDRATLHPHWVHLYRSGYKFSPAWQGEFFLSKAQAAQHYDLLIETMQITQPANRLQINGTEIAFLRPRARPDITSTWVTQRFTIPPGLLVAGANRIRLSVGPRNPARQYITAHWENMQFRHIRLVPAEESPPPMLGNWQRQPTPGGWSESNRLRRAPNGHIWLTGNRPGQVWQVETTAPPTLINQAGNRPDLLFHDVLSLPQGEEVAATQHGLFRRGSPQPGWQPIENAPAGHAYVVQQANRHLFAGFEGAGLWQAPAPAGPWQPSTLTATTIVDLVSVPQLKQPDHLYAVAESGIFFNDGVSKNWASLPLPGLTAEQLQDAGEFAGDKLSPRLFLANDGRLLLRHQDRLWLQVASSRGQGAGAQGRSLPITTPVTRYASRFTQNWQLFGPEHLRGKSWSVTNCCGPGAVVGTYRAGMWQLADDGRWQRIDGEFFGGTDITALLHVDDALIAAGDLGVFASTGGEAWQAVAGLPPIVSDLLVDPAEPARWVAGTPAGVYRSLDAGQTWQAISPPWTVWDMAFGPQGRLFVGRSSGMVWTDNLAAGPVPWQGAGGMKQVYFLSVNPHPVEPDLVWAGTWGNNIGYSIDGGQNIDPLHNGLETLSGLDILWHPAPGQVTLATIEGLYRTDNGGESWFKLPGPLQHQTVYALRQTADGIIWAGAADGLWKSRDYGSTWKKVVDIPPASVLRLGALNRPETEWLWAGTEGAGLWISRDNGQTWAFAGLPERAVYNAFFDPSQPGRLVAATAAGIFTADVPQQNVEHGAN